MNTEELFRATLQKLAAEGVQDAVLALKLAESILPSPIVRIAAVRGELHNAHTCLLKALMHNDREWTSSTDVAINAALTSIARGIGELG